MVRLIIGTAIGQYGYDPDASDNNANKSTGEELAELRTCLDLEKIRERLKKFVGFLPGGDS